MFNTVQHPQNPKYILLTCDLGDEVFVPLGNIIVKCKVLAIQNYLLGPENKSVWATIDRRPDGTVRHTYQRDTGMCDEGGWTITETVEGELNYPLLNQTICVDEPIGHGLVLGDEAFETLEDALRHVYPSKKKHLKRRLQSYRNKTAAWIASTWLSGNKYCKVTGRNRLALIKQFKTQNNDLFKTKRVYVKRK